MNVALATPALDIEPFDAAFLSDPYSHHAALREAGAVVWLKSLGVFGMARHAEVHAALKDWRTFSSSRGVGLADFAKEEPWRPPSLLLEADPPLHQRTRGIMNRIISFESLKALKPVWQERADKLVDRLVARRHFDAVVDLAEAFPLVIFPEAVGLPEAGRENLLVYAAAVFNAFGPRNAIFNAGAETATQATAWVAQACRRNNLTSGGWGLEVYAAADRGECTDEEAARLVRSILSAGVDTTVNGIGNMIYAFTRFRDQWDRLRNDPSLTRRAFEESLRWDSTVQTFFRTSTRDVEVAGTVIPEGSKVLLFLAAANRDPRKWQDPERFDIGRQTGGHVAFGFGIHQCLGQLVARLEAEVILAAMLPRIAAIRAVGEPVRRLNNTLHAISSLPVEIDPT
jgi:cytochrome P450